MLLRLGIGRQCSEGVAEFVEAPLRNFADKEIALVAAVGLEPFSRVIDSATY